MATYGWGSPHPVEEWLLAEAYRFDFHQAMRLLALMRPEAEGLTVELLPVPAKEVTP